MEKATSLTVERFHGQKNLELKPGPAQINVISREYYVVQERKVSYTFYLHQHPYVQSLIQQLIRKGTAGLQAADTEYNTRIKFSGATAARCEWNNGSITGLETLLSAGRSNC